MSGTRFAVARRPWLLAALSLAAVAVVAAILLLVLSGERPDSRRVPPPDPPAPIAPVVEVVAEYPGTSPEEIERQVTIPLEITLAGIPGLKTTLSRSLFSLAHLDLEFTAGTDFDKARQEVINRLQLAQGLPPGVTPTLVPARRFTHELLRYTLSNPRNELGQAVYTLHDLRALQDAILAREFLRLPGVVQVVSAGGTVKRYEIHPDPERLKRFGISLEQLQNAIANRNANVGGDFLKQGKEPALVRPLGLLGIGADPMDKALAMKSAPEAAAYLRAEEARHLRELRDVVIAQVNQVPVRVDDVVAGGPLVKGAPSSRGVVVSHHPRLGQVSCDRASPAGKGWEREDETVLGILRARKDGDAAAFAASVRARVGELNGAAGRLLPGVRIVPYPGVPARTDTLWIRGEFPANISLEAASQQVRAVRALLSQFPEVDAILSQLGRPEGGADPGPLSSVEIVVGLKPPETWPAPAGKDQPRTRAQLTTELRRELGEKFVGVYWSCSADRAARLGPFNLGEGEHLVKIYGPSLAKLQETAEQVRDRLRAHRGVEGVGVFGGLGASNLEFRVDREKCRRWGIKPAHVINILTMALHGKVVTQMTLGEASWDITVRWPADRRRDTASILDIPVDAWGGDGAVKARLRLGDLVSPIGEDGKADPKGRFVRPAASVIHRENSQRVIALKFRVGGRDGAAVVAKAQAVTAILLQAPYRAEWVRP
jgi:Cu/Ag efflux pump CusA